MKLLAKLLILILVLEIYGFFYLQTNHIILKTQQITDSELSKTLKDLKIVQISDLHIRRFGDREKRLVSFIKNINPDIIFITGDFAANNKGIQSCIELLEKFPVSSKTLAILGNNDHTYKSEAINTDLLIKELNKIGITVLINESVKITIEDKAKMIQSFFYVVGLDDNYLWLDDIFKAMENVPEGSPKILLAHAPNIVEKINTKGINLILSGHTHGGQIALPFIGALYTNPICNAKKKFVSGLYKEDTNLYVNRGIGTVEIPLRLFARPEITVFEFKA